MSNSQSVPRRQDLIDRLQRANKNAWPVIFALILSIAIFSALIDWERASKEPLLSLIAIAVAAGPFARDILMFAVVKRKRVQDLKEHTRFGQYDKYLLQSLYKETMTRLKLPDFEVPLFIVADRSMNAAAMHLGFGSFFKSINGIYLHRQVLHKLQPQEVQDIIGHELGHYFKYYLVVDRFRILTVTLATLAALWVIQINRLDGFAAYMVISLVPATIWWISGLPYAYHATAIEYLCDDFGAQVNGIIPAVNGLMKIGAEAELQTIVIQQATMSKAAGNLNASELIETILNSMPYGTATKEEIETKVNAEIKKRAENRDVTLGGFFNFLWNSEQEVDSELMLEEQVKAIQRQQSKPRLDWEALLLDAGNIDFDEESLPMLIAMIDRDPTYPLFRISESQEDGVHPPIKSRIVYLWNNRAEIEKSLS
ncbi:MAG: M48 family metalloprotease [Planctomycetota bacterium]|nr:M48 family metalloprotease [Planctomycetota bacterium]